LLSVTLASPKGPFGESPMLLVGVPEVSTADPQVTVDWVAPESWVFASAVISVFGVSLNEGAEVVPVTTPETPVPIPVLPELHVPDAETDTDTALELSTLYPVGAPVSVTEYVPNGKPPMQTAPVVLLVVNGLPLIAVPPDVTEKVAPPSFAVVSAVDGPQTPIWVGVVPTMMALPAVWVEQPLYLPVFVITIAPSCCWLT
jgi:hypothetical protein